MRLSTAELDKAIEWCEREISGTKHLINDDGCPLSSLTRQELLLDLSNLETCLDSFKYIKERDGFI